MNGNFNNAQIPNGPLDNSNQMMTRVSMNQGSSGDVSLDNLRMSQGLVMRNNLNDQKSAPIMADTEAIMNEQYN